MKENIKNLEIRLGPIKIGRHLEKSVETGEKGYPFQIGRKRYLLHTKDDWMLIVGPMLVGAGALGLTITGLAVNYLGPLVEKFIQNHNLYFEYLMH